MRKLIIFILISLFLCLAGVCAKKDIGSLKDLFPNAQIEVYTKNVTRFDENYITNGDGYIIYSTINNFCSVFEKHDVTGYTIKINNTSPIQICKKLKASCVVYDGGYMYGYSCFFPGEIILKDIKVNFQCAFWEDKILIGTPILLGSY